MIRGGFPGRSRSGMSMLEVMVAIALILVMSLSSWQVIASAIEVRKVLSERDATTRGARVALSMLRREIALAYLTPNVQAVNTYQTVFVGRDENPDRLYMASLSHRRLYRDSRECDQTEITAWTEPSPERGQGYVLYHREAPRVDEEPDEDGVIYPLAYNVRSFDLRYLDPTINEWVEEWDSRSPDWANRLPRAVQIGLVLLTPDPEDEDRNLELPFLTTVRLEYAEPLQRSIFAGDGQ